MSKKTKTILIILAVLILAVISGVIWYISGKQAVDRSNTKDIIFKIEESTRTTTIVKNLKEQNLIKNELIAKVYLKLHNIRNLQAGKYTLNQTMNMQEIFSKISKGEIFDESVKITFLEGKNIKHIAKKISEETNNSEEDVYNLLKDTEYIRSLIEKYWFISDSILIDGIYYPLEGYLYPDTYIFESKDVSVKTIFNTILENTEKILEKYKEEITSRKVNIHQLLTIASIVEIEGNDKQAREGIASVIFNRLKSKMSLGSDVTTYYAIQVDMGERNLRQEEINTYNQYNTRGPNMAGKLPIGPICNPSSEAIEATLNPADTTYLYFVGDSNGKIYFTNNYEEHKQKISDLKQQGLWYEYE